MFCSAKCYRDDKNSIKEVEGAEDNEEDNADKNMKNSTEINIEATESENEIDILDIQEINYCRKNLFFNYLLILYSINSN